MRSQLRARNERNATRTAIAMYLVSSVVVLTSNVVSRPVAGFAAVVFGAPVFLGLLAVALVLGRPNVRRPLLSATPFLAVVIVLALDLMTMDTSTAAQVPFFLPVLLASYQFRPLNAALVALASLAADAYLVYRLDPGMAGAVDVLYMALVVGLLTGLLVTSGVRHDRLVAQLRHQASVDPLTGLDSRRVLDEATRAALARARAPGTALLLVDVDHFKGVNDTYGHIVGDDALVHVGRLLEAVVAPTQPGGDAGADRHGGRVGWVRQLLAGADTSGGDVAGGCGAPGGAVVARMGGDELAAMLPACAVETAERAADDLVRQVRSTPLLVEGAGPVELTVSVGVAHTEGPVGLRELYGAADASLYRAKRAGRDGVGASARSPFLPVQRAADTVAE